LPDEWKWRIRHYIKVQQVPPPRASVLRVSRHPNARFNLGCPVRRVALSGAGIAVETPRKMFNFDFLILSTGFMIDWESRPEYAVIAPHVQVWGDRHSFAADQDDRELSGSPYLGPYFEFQEKVPGALPGLSRIHCFSYPASLTHGSVSGDIPAISDGALRLAQGISGLFYGEDIEHNYALLQAFDEPEVFGDEWVAAAAEQPLEDAASKTPF